MPFQFDKLVPRLQEVLSPEGVFERVEREITFRMTLTGGGKLRVYIVDDQGARSVGVYDTRDEAMESMGTGMIFHGGLTAFPRPAGGCALQWLAKPG